MILCNTLQYKAKAKANATNPGLGIWDLAWNLAIRVKFGTISGPKFVTFIANMLCFREGTTRLVDWTWQHLEIYHKV